MHRLASVSETDFIVGVTSLRFGHSFDQSTELLSFTEPGDGTYLPAIMDSGTSCLVMPGDTVRDIFFSCCDTLGLNHA
jgi:hypothetical protein